MNPTEIKTLIKQELPSLIKEDKKLQQFILDLAQAQFADKQETESRFDRILNEMKRDREEQHILWAKHQAEESKKWAENTKQWAIWKEDSDKKWAENTKQWAIWKEDSERHWQKQEATDNDIKRLTRRIDSTLGALGARWGLHSEQSFRNALKGILEESFEVEVQNITDFDEDGFVFGQPDQIELDIIIHNGTLILCELKSSMSRSDMYTFQRKVKFYEKKYARKVTRKVVVSPMIDGRAREIAILFEIETYSHADEVGTA